MYIYFRYNASGNLFDAEVLIKSNEANAPTFDNSDIVAFSWLDLGISQDLPAPSFGAIRVGSSTLRFVSLSNAGF